jgi:hypothetical protein
MALTIQTGKAPAAWFEPAFGDNRSLPEGVERIEVEIEPMSAAEANAKKEADIGGGIRKGANINLTRLARKHRNSVIEAHVIGVRGVDTKDADGKVTLITTGKELVAFVSASNNAALDALLDEIFEAITDQSVLAEGVRKN